MCVSPFYFCVNLALFHLCECNKSCIPSAKISWECLGLDSPAHSHSLSAFICSFEIKIETFLVQIQNGNIKKDSFLNDGLLSMGSPFSLSHVRRGETESLSIHYYEKRKDGRSPPYILYMYALCIHIVSVSSV
jgi:hypothetical protein